MWWVAVAAASTGTGRMEGVVTSGLDGRALPNVDVVLRVDAPPSAPEAPPLRHVRTDLSGGFRFEDLPPGLYSLDVLGWVPPGPAAESTGAWTHVTPLLVAPGLTATPHVVLAAPQPPAGSARDS